MRAYNALFAGLLEWSANCISGYDMNPALLTAAAGMRARMETLDVIGNNIANAGVRPAG